MRASISLPVNVAAQVRNMAKTRRLSSNRMLKELIENGIEAEKQEFFELAELFRNATDPEEAKRLDNWAEWSLASDAQDRAFGQSSRRGPPAFDSPDG